MKRALIVTLIILIFVGIGIPAITAGPLRPGDEPGYQCGWYPYYFYEWVCTIDGCFRNIRDVGIYWDCK